MVLPSFLADDGQTVAEGDDDFFHPVVLGNDVVEAADALRLVVAVVVGVDYMTVPEGVVGKDYRSFRHYREQHLVGLGVCPLVSVEESEVE